MEIEKKEETKRRSRSGNLEDEGTWVYTFGYGKHGQLGHGGVNQTFLVLPTLVSSLSGRMVSQVSCGGVFTACLTTFGDVYTWGDNRNGLPSIESHLRGKNIVKIASSAMLTFALTKSGEVYSWGEVPPPPPSRTTTTTTTTTTTGDNNKPVLRSPCILRGDIHNKKIMKIACGALHALFLDNEGKVYSMGSNTCGQLGSLQVSTKEEILHPKLITILNDYVITDIACGGSHSIALSSSSDIWVWGSNKYGQLALDRKYQFVQIPILLKHDIPSPHIIACGDYHTMVVTSKGELYTFGQGRCGQLGTGNLEDSFDPQPVPSFNKKDEKIIQICGGGGFGCSHCLALTSKGILYSWGNGTKGQLGHEPLLKDEKLPKPIVFFERKRILDFSCGWLHSTVLIGNIPQNLNNSNFNSYSIINHSLGHFYIVPNDVLLIILMFCRDAKSLAMLGASSKFFYDFTSSDALWAALYHTHFAVVSAQHTVGTAGGAIKWKQEYIEQYKAQNGIMTDLIQLRQIQPVTSKFPFSVLELFNRREIRVLMVGLDAPGKTTILYKLKIGEIVTTIPTIGFNVETVSYLNCVFTFWDVGGPDKIRPLWCHYYANTQAVIFVVDSNDRDRIDEAAQEFKRLVRELETQECIFLIFANKQDLPSALTPRQVAIAMGIHTMGNKRIHVQGSVATTGEGLYEGLQWLSANL